MVAEVVGTSLQVPSDAHGTVPSELELGSTYSN